MDIGIDYAWEHVPIKALKDWGADFAARYLSPDSAKNLSAAEAIRLATAGVWCVVVWESTANRALSGRRSGADDAKAAAAQAKACGMPDDRPIYFAVDFDASLQDQTLINAYLDGAASVLGKNRVGIYGGYWPVKRALDGGHCVWAWQTYAWSGGKWDPRAQFQQYHNDIIVGGVGCDADRATVLDYGQWKPGVSPAKPEPKPVEEDDMPTGQLNLGVEAETVFALPKGRYTNIAFICDNRRTGKPPVNLRVAIQKGPDDWQIEPITVDGKTGQRVVHFKDVANTIGVSVTYVKGDPGNVPVGYEVS